MLSQAQKFLVILQKKIIFHNEYTNFCINSAFSYIYVISEADHYIVIVSFENHILVDDF